MEKTFTRQILEMFTKKNLKKAFSKRGFKENWRHGLLLGFFGIFFGLWITSLIMKITGFYDIKFFLISGFIFTEGFIIRFGEKFIKVIESIKSK